jgi:predicted transcriptional regulator
MRTENVMYFTDKEEDFANLLIEIGTKRNVAKVLVFLANTPEATSRAIERGTDLRQPEVSIAMHYLTDQEWITSRESKAESKGRPVKIYELSKPINEIMDVIEKRKKQETQNQLAIIQKLQDYIR